MKKISRLYENNNNKLLYNKVRNFCSIIMNLFILIIFIVLFTEVYEVSSKKHNREVIIKASFNGGRGSSIIFIQKLLENIKHRISDQTQCYINDEENKLSIKIVLVNLKYTNLSDIEDKLLRKYEINQDEFNLFLEIKTRNAKSNKTFLIGSSDPKIKKIYFEYLNTGISTIEKAKFISAMTRRIIRLIKNKII
jgi:hypothetical protein